MKTPLTLGIDAGTGSAKAVLADVSGGFFAQASSAYSIDVPVSGAAEQEPEVWWRAVATCVRELLAKHPGSAERLQAVAISGQGAAAVVLDAEQKPLRPAMLWMDTRCAVEAHELASASGQHIAKISGKVPAAYNVEPKLIWLRRHEPELFRQVRTMTTTTGYLYMRMTGTLVMNHSDAGILLGYALRESRWSEEALGWMDLPAQLYPPLEVCSRVSGYVSSEAAAQTGLPMGMPVVAGGEDTSSAGLSMGILTPGQVQLSMGTACTVNVAVRESPIEPRLLAFPHVIEGLTLMGGSMVAGGSSMEWITRVLGRHTETMELRSEHATQLSALAAAVPQGAGGVLFLPYLAGELQPVNDGLARGGFFGVTFSTGTAELVRAVLEGTAFAIRHNLSLVGGALECIHATGAPVMNDVWCQIIADVTGLRVLAMSERAGAPLGNAILAAMGVGLVRGPLEMQQRHVAVRRVFTPDGKAVARYNELFPVYCELYPRLKDLFARPALQGRLGNVSI